MMDPLVAPIVISFLALLVSAYGILERQSATRRELRDRLLAIVDELHELAVQEDREASDRGMDDWGLLSAIAAQRMRLAQQAVLLEGMIKGRHLTSEEYATIAMAFERSGDLDQALGLWKRAVTLAAKGSVMAEAANWRSTARCHWLRGEYPAMRQATARALDIIPTWHDQGRYEYAMTCADLAEGELRASGNDSPDFRDALAQGFAMAERIGDGSRATVTSVLAGIETRANESSATRPESHA